MIDMNMTAVFAAFLFGMATVEYINWQAARDMRRKLVTNKALVIRSK